MQLRSINLLQLVRLACNSMSRKSARLVRVSVIVMVKRVLRYITHRPYQLNVPVVTSWLAIVGMNGSIVKIDRV